MGGITFGAALVHDVGFSCGDVISHLLKNSMSVVQMLKEERQKIKIERKGSSQMLHYLYLSFKAHW